MHTFTFHTGTSPSRSSLYAGLAPKLNLCKDLPLRSQYLGIPLGAGLLTRMLCLYFTSRHFFTARFLPLISPLGPLGLLYTIVVLFAYQGHHIVHNIGHVFRVIVPLVLYFTVMWAGAFALVWWLGRRAQARGQGNTKQWSYEMAVVQSFTAGSNNFVRSNFQMGRRALTDDWSLGTRNLLSRYRLQCTESGPTRLSRRQSGLWSKCQCFSP